MSSIASSNTLHDLATSLGTNAESVASFMASPTSVRRRRCSRLPPAGRRWRLFYEPGAVDQRVLPRSSPQTVSTRRDDLHLLGRKYVGRWMPLAFFGVIQALVVSIGDLIIGVQTVSRPTFVGTSIIISMVYVSIVCMLSTILPAHRLRACASSSWSCRFRLCRPSTSEMLHPFFSFLHPGAPFHIWD